MAFSLEAALVVPVSIAILTVVTATVLPVYNQIRRQTVASAVTCSKEGEKRSLYRLNVIASGNLRAMRLQTCPGHGIEMLRLAKDLYRPGAQVELP